MISLTNRIGKNIAEPSSQTIKESMEELYKSDDAEHNSIAISNEKEIFIEFYRGFVVIEDLTQLPGKELLNIDISEELALKKVDLLKVLLDQNDIQGLVSELKS